MYWELLPFSKFAKTSFCKKCGVTPFYQMTADLVVLDIQTHTTTG